MQATSAAGSRLGKYELIELLGSGGMADVWLARMGGAAGFAKSLVLKMIRHEWAEDASFVTMFVDEACLSAKLSHPNIVETLDFGCVQGRYFIALEWVDGIPLRSIEAYLHKHDRRLELDVAAHVVAQVAAALGHAHEATDAEGNWLGIVHRDVNPANVLVSTHGEVKLTDFGIAKAAGRALQTEAGSLKGKIPYMSPEQALARPVDGRSDLYALGLMLYELVFGRRALRGDSELEVLERAQSADISPMPADADPRLVEILGRALSRDADARYANAAQLRADLQVLMRSDRDRGARLAALVQEVRDAIGAITPVHPPVAASTPTPPETPGSTKLTRPDRPLALERPPPSKLPWIAAGVLGVAFAGLGALRWYERPEMPSSRGAPAAPAAPIEISAPAVITPTLPSPEPASKEHQVEPKPVRHLRAGTATLRIRVEPWGEVWVDNRPLGQTPLAPLELAAGPHNIVAKNPAFGTLKKTVTLSPGDARLVELGPGR
jgi:serine/threonine protein kinase